MHQPITTVAASELVRNFGKWRDLASHEPVFIRHRGRPSLVLSSVRTMASLAGGQAHRPRDLIDIDDLMEAIRQPVLVTDHDLTILEIGRAARLRLGKHALPGAALASVLPESLSPLLSAAARRIRSTRAEERIEVRLDGEDGSEAEIHMSPLADGIVVTIVDLAPAAAASRIEETANASLSALQAMPCLATARISLRGYIRTVDPSLVRITGFDRTALERTRFVTLADLGNRALVADAIETAIDLRRPAFCVASLLQQSGTAISAQISIAPELHGANVTGAVAIIATQGPAGMQDAKALAGS